MPKPDLVLVAGGARRVSPRRRSADDVLGLYRLRRMIEPALAAESCLRIPSRELDRLEAHIPFFAADSEQVYAAHRAFHLELLRPAASRWDLRVLRPLWAEADGLVRAVFGPEGRTSCDVILTACSCRALLAGYRTRDPKTAHAASQRYLDHAEGFVRRILAGRDVPPPVRRAPELSPVDRARPAVGSAAVQVLRW